MTYIPEKLRREVIERANNCCEYCRIHQDDVYFSHQIDHIIAEKHRGETEADNLCLSCSRCNINKGSDIASIDPENDAIVRLFNPRQDQWEDHFYLNGVMIETLTAVGRVTEFVLKLNSLDQLIRREELSTERYPCPKSE